MTTTAEAEALLAGTFERLRESGYNVVAVVSRYDASGARFHAHLHLAGDELEQEHALLDAFRELMIEWHNLRHLHSHLVMLDLLEPPPHGPDHR